MRATVLAVVLAAACGEGRPPCPGAVRCNGTKIEICERDPSGAETWALGGDCASLGDMCYPDSDCPHDFVGVPGAGACCR